MKTALRLFVAIAVLLPAYSFARIGETPEQCKTRYGSPLSTNEIGGLLFRKGPLLFQVTFFEGKCDSIIFNKEEKNVLGKPAEMSDNEIVIILKANGGDRKWKALPVSPTMKVWKTEDGTITAVYTFFENGLAIITEEYVKRQMASESAKDKKGLEGF
ncbi:MAG: hypothetical protein ACOYOU_00985 [Kiritimatiellia bacterium]